MEKNQRKQSRLKTNCFFQLMMLFLASCRSNTLNHEKYIETVALTNCHLIRDSVDFGEGYATYDHNLLCLDTIFNYDCFDKYIFEVEYPVIRRNSDTIFISKDQTNPLKLLLDDTFVIMYHGRERNILTSLKYCFENAVILNYHSRDYVIAILKQIGGANSKPAYSFIVLDENLGLIQFIEKPDQLSPNPNCFCDINNDGKIDYLQVDRNNGVINFYTLENWEPLTKYSLKIHSLIDNIYAIEN